MKTEAGHWLDMVEVIFAAKTGNLRKLAELAGGDPETFYLGTDLTGLSVNAEISDIATLPPDAEPDFPPAPMEDTTTPPGFARDRILIIALDKAAARLAKLISTDNLWLGLSDRELKSLGLDPATFNRFALETVNLIEGDILPDFVTKLVPGYAVVVFLFDGTASVQILTESLSRVVVQLRSGSDTVLIGAPVLRSDSPSGTFAGLLQAPARTGLSCLVDTSVARSPFWPVRSKRSFDRRMADLTLTAAWNCLHNWQLRAFLNRNGPDHGLLLSLAWGPRNAIGELDLVSENSAYEPAKQPSSEPFFKFDFELGAEGRQMQQGKGEVRTYRASFQAFAQEIIESSVPYYATPHTVRPIAFPKPIQDVLVHPDYAAGFEAWQKRVVLTAETPSLDATRRARDLGWLISRYTDDDRLGSFVQADRSQTGSTDLPAEITLPRLSRLDRNIRLATRGVDPRDIIEVTPPTYYSLSSGFSASHLGSLLRNYREAPHEKSPRTILPLREVFQWAERGNSDAEKILAAAEAAGKWNGRRPPAKRLSDLDIAWSPVAEGARRYVLQDGALPVELNTLDDREVPAQNMFIIDGDKGVVALFKSRLFNVWARTTRTRSMGWPSRFAISKTFETFPIPEMFSVRLIGEGRPATLYTDGSFMRQANIRSVENAVLPADRGGVDEAFSVERLDELLLSELRLNPHASDLDILQRLIEINLHVKRTDS